MVTRLKVPTVSDRKRTGDGSTMRKSSKSRESGESKLLNNRNVLYQGIMARAVVQQNEGTVVLPYNPSKSPDSEITLIGCDVEVGDLDTFGIITTVTNIYYDTDGQPATLFVDVNDQFGPTEAEIVAACEGESVSDDKTESDDETDSDEPDSSSQSDTSDDSSSYSSPSGRDNSPSTQSGRMMRDLLGKGKP
jgi:hypothetical protein